MRRICICKSDIKFYFLLYGKKPFFSLCLCLWAFLKSSQRISISIKCLVKKYQGTFCIYLLPESSMANLGNLFVLANIVNKWIIVRLFTHREYSRWRLNEEFCSVVKKTIQRFSQYLSLWSLCITYKDGSCGLISYTICLHKCCLGDATRIVQAVVTPLRTEYTVRTVKDWLKMKVSIIVKTGFYYNRTDSVLFVLARL